MFTTRPYVYSRRPRVEATRHSVQQVSASGTTNTTTASRQPHSRRSTKPMQHQPRIPIPHLADFASQMACFLWFGQHHQPAQLAKTAGQRRYPIVDFTPRPGFSKFCLDVLNTTQVSHSVVILSLLYIYRLKRNNPAIRGAEGSEYRLFVVGLMLANKFLDDNTFTTRTWSEVTGIPVREINKVEIEFLTALGWTLYVSESQYVDWLRNLEQFVALKDQIVASRAAATAAKNLQRRMILTPPASPTDVDFDAAVRTASKRTADQANLNETSTLLPSKRAQTGFVLPPLPQHRIPIILPPPSALQYYTPPPLAPIPKHPTCCSMVTPPNLISRPLSRRASRPASISRDTSSSAAPYRGFGFNFMPTAIVA